MPSGGALAPMRTPKHSDHRDNRCVIMSSMYALIGGRRSPFFKHSPLTTHHDARMMTSIAMINARGRNGTAHHYAYLKVLPDSGVVLCCDA
eukprot:superscaffoldBa00001022_g8559